jgi:hypothetical protein
VQKSFQGPHHAVNNAVFELRKRNEIQVNASDDGIWKRKRKRERKRKSIITINTCLLMQPYRRSGV